MILEVQGFHVLACLWCFAVGAVIGSFLNVCIYRLPWEKSVLWPASTCPRCLRPIAAADNIPIVSWIALRGECRRCGLPIAPRYALIELLVGLLFAAVYVVDVVQGPYPLLAWEGFARLAYHAFLVALLVAATFTDYDLQVIPDAITRTGTVFGLVLGAIFPGLRPAPAGAATTFGAAGPVLLGGLIGAALGWGVERFVGAIFRGDEPEPDGSAEPPRERVGLPMIGFFLGWQLAAWPRVGQWGGLVIGVEGFLIGGAIVWFFRVGGEFVFRREAMGFGDITLMAMIGSFLGWQAALVAFFLAPFFGLAHALWKLFAWIGKRLAGRQSSAADREMAFGPYLAMAALLLVLTWPRLMVGWALPLFEALGSLARFTFTGEF